MWMAALARQHPHLRLLTVSPGSTHGTEVMSSMPIPARLLVGKIFMPLIAPMLGLAHSLQKGAERIVEG